MGMIEIKIKIPVELIALLFLLSYRQGFPETEKLLMIGNIFEVSIDYLLKETAQSKEENDDGYYVSKEMAEGFLLNQRYHSIRLYSIEY